MPTHILLYVSITRNKGVRWRHTETVSQISLSSLKLLSSILWQEQKALTSATTCNLLCASWEKYTWLIFTLCFIFFYTKAHHDALLSRFTPKCLGMAGLPLQSFWNYRCVSVYDGVYIPVNPLWSRSWVEHLLICLTAALSRVLIAGSLDYIAGSCGTLPLVSIRIVNLGEGTLLKMWHPLNGSCFGTS